jgi:hypothetical protein
VPISLICRMILSKQSAIFWDHALASQELVASGLWCKPSESMKRTLGNIVRLKRRELHSRLPAPYCL